MPSNYQQMQCIDTHYHLDIVKEGFGIVNEKSKEETLHQPTHPHTQVMM
jgi:hypothetical protein